WIGVLGDVGAQVLVAEPQPESTLARRVVEHEGLDLGRGRVGDALVPEAARLVVTRVEQTVVHPDGVDASGRHEHRRWLAVEARQRLLVRTAPLTARRRLVGGTALRVTFDELAHVV